MTIANETIESIDLKSWVLPIAAGVLCACLGIWIGFKMAGGSVTDLQRCEDCDDKARETAILDAEE